MQLDERNNLTKLFDTYGALLSKKQNEVMQKLLYLDIGESEIAELSGESRQSIHDAITKAKTQLFEFEEKCKVLEDKQNLKQKFETALEVLRRKDTAEAIKELQSIIDNL